MSESKEAIVALVVERLKEQARKHVDAGAYGLDLGFLPEPESERIGDAILSALKESVEGPWPEQKPTVKCELEGSVLRTTITMLPGPAADQLARAGVDIRCADGSRDLPFDREFTVLLKEES